MYENLPTELTTGQRFVCWQRQERAGKDTKVPMSPHGGYAMVNNPETWGMFQEAVTHREKQGLSGIGTVLSKKHIGDKLVGIDLDHCINDAGNLSPEAKEIVETLNSYSEITPSGGGLHIFVNGELPDGARRKGPVEIYDDLRYLTLTGDHLEGTPKAVETRQDELFRVWKKYVSTPAQTGEERTTSTAIIRDDDLIQKAMSAANGATFRRLWTGDLSDYPSQSEGDLALCSILAFWTQGDAGRIDNFFRQSALYRSKWDEIHVQGRTYGEETIRKAVDGTKAFCGDKAVRLVTKEEKTEVSSMRFPHTDYGNAERFVYRFGQDIHFVPSRNKWIIWDGSYWEWDDKNVIEKLAKLTVRGILEEAVATDTEAWKQLCKHAVRSENASRIKAMIDLAQSEDGVAIRPNELDRDPYLLNVANGTLDLRTGELREPSRADLITRKINVPYEPLTRSCLWENFLSRVMRGNQGLISFLQKAVGYSLSGDTSEQVLFFSHGRGANGKSTFIETLTSLLGDYSKHTRPETFMLKNTDASANNDLAELEGTRMVAAVELEEGRRLAEILTKQCTGGDTIKARYLFQEYFEFRAQFKLWLCGNHKPKIMGTDHAIWRRIKLIPWTVTIPDEEQDKKLLQKLRDEWTGILSWAIKGCMDWQREGLAAPSEVIAATAEYRKEQDILGDFFDNCVDVEPGASCPVKALYEAYSEYCEANGESMKERLGKKKFGVRVFERGFDQYSAAHNVQTWIGLKVKG